MNCYRHEQNVAVAICKVCGRAAGRCCTKEQESGIVCSDKCAVNAARQWEMTSKALKLYRIGQPPRSAMRFSNPIFFAVLPGLVFLGFGAASSIHAGGVDFADAFPIVLGGVFVVSGLWADRQQRKAEADLASTSAES